MKKILLITTIMFGIGAIILFFNNNAGTEAPNASKKYIPNVTVKDLDGKDVELKTLVNGKLTLFLFWATWCPSCRQELAEVEKYYPKYKDKGLSIIAFSVDENVAEVIKYIKENNLLIKIMMSNADLSSAYGGIRAVPTTFLLDNEGQIKNRIIGYNPRIEDEIKKYLNMK